LDEAKRRLTESIRLRIPKVASQAEARKMERISSECGRREFSCNRVERKSWNADPKV